MKLSARNIIPGKVLEVHKGATTTTVRIAVTPDVTMTSSITNEAAEDLGLKSGLAVKVVVKSSDVILAVD